MLVRREVLAAAGGLERIRGARIDDIALARLLKRPPVAARCWLGFSTAVRSLRPYPRLALLWGMVARSAYTQLRYSPALLAGVVAGLAWLYLLPPVAAIGGLAALASGRGHRGGLVRRGGPRRVGGAGGDVRPAAQAVPVVLVACPRAAAGGAAVHRDDGGLGAAPLRRPRRRVEGPHDPRLNCCFFVRRAGADQMNVRVQLESALIPFLLRRRAR